MRRNYLWYLALLFTSSTLNVNAQMMDNTVPLSAEEDKENRNGPINYGRGSGISLHSRLRAAFMTDDTFSPQTTGVFGPTVSWPLNAIHVILLPDGRVLSYGIKTANKLNYDVWNPSQGTDSTAHMLLPNTTGTSIFCIGQSIIPINGNILLTGGTTALNGIANTGIERTTTFDPKSNMMQSAQSMIYKRWYATIVPLVNGDKLILGGREDTTVRTPKSADWNYATTPELFTNDGAWRVLPGAASDAAFGGKVGVNWSYPRAYQMPNDPAKVFVLAHDGTTYYLTPAGDGTLTKLAKKTLRSDNRLPTVMFAPGKLLSVRSNQRVIVVDINGPQPAITTTANLSQLRYFANATVLPDGKVLVTGGSAVPNQINGIANAAEIWDPATGTWTLGATATIPRLYHSTALLLPDGSVLTTGGGNPGPVTNLNAEIYYPSYLFDASGNWAARPTLLAAPNLLTLHSDTQFSATVAPDDQISRVTLLHTNSVTHANDVEQRFQDLPFTQTGQALQITSPTNPGYTVPGYYMLFVFNGSGVPSLAKIIGISG